MKKLSLILIALVISSSSFAYYGSYSSDTSEWLSFIAVVMFICGILEIVLFYKIWDMTNDIKALKKDYFCETQFESKEEIAKYLRKNLMLGNKDTVKRILLQNFIDNVDHGYSKLKPGTYDKSGNNWVSYDEKNMKESIAPYVKNLMLQFAKIGEEVPAYIARMETFGDYYKFFIAEDLVAKYEKKAEEGKHEGNV